MANDIVLPVFLSKFLKQTAIYWAVSGRDGYGGYTFSSPIDIICRWTEKSDNAMGDDGNEFVSMAEVNPDRVLLKGGYLKLGSVDIGTQSDPTNEPDAFIIKQFAQISTVKANKVWYRALL